MSAGTHWDHKTFQNTQTGQVEESRGEEPCYTLQGTCRENPAVWALVKKHSQVLAKASQTRHWISQHPVINTHYYLILILKQSSLHTKQLHKHKNLRLEGAEVDSSAYSRCPFQSCISLGSVTWLGTRNGSGFIQAEDDKGILEACDFNKAQNSCKSSNNFFPFMNHAHKSIHK